MLRLASPKPEIHSRDEGWQFLMGERRTTTRPRMASAPLLLAIVWLGSTYLLSFVVEPPPLLGGQLTPRMEIPYSTALVVVSALLLACGYGLGLRGRDWHSVDGRAMPSSRIRSAWATRLMGLSALWYVVASVQVYVFRGFGSIGGIVEGLVNPASSFKTAYSMYGEAGGGLTQLLYLTSVLLLFLPLLLPRYWSRLPVAARSVGSSILVVYVCLSLATGVSLNSGLTALLLVAGLFLLWGTPKRVVRGRIARPSRAAAISVGLILVATMAAFVFARGERTQVNGAGASNFKANPYLTEMVGEDLSRGIGVTLFYPTHGYYGLGVSLAEPFVWTSGYGGSRAAEYYLTKLGATPQSDLTYAYRAWTTFGYSNTQYWRTAYASWASDVSFFGVPLLMLLIGFAWSRSFHRAVVFEDQLAAGLFGLITVTVAFVPASNIVGDYAPLFLALVTLGIFALGRRIAAPKRKELDVTHRGGRSHLARRANSYQY